MTSRVRVKREGNVPQRKRMTLSEVNFDNWHISEITTNSRGARSAAISEQHAGVTKPIVLQLTPMSDPLQTPFGINSYGQEETMRKSLELRCTPALEQFLRRLDDWAKTTWPSTQIGSSRARRANSAIVCNERGTTPVRCVAN